MAKLVVLFGRERGSVKAYYFFFWEEIRGSKKHYLYIFLGIEFIESYIGYIKRKT